MHIFKIESKHYKNICRLINFVRDQVFFALVPISMGFTYLSRGKCSTFFVLLTI